MVSSKWKIVFIGLILTLAFVLVVRAGGGEREWYDSCPSDPPTPTPWPEQPTYTPRPTYTPEPTPTCRPTTTPLPTEPPPTPYPTATPYPTSTPYPSQPAPPAAPTIHVYPGESISDAVNGALPGDIVYLHGGTYVGELVRITASGAEGNLIVVKAYPGDTVVIDGQYEGGTWDELVNIAGDHVVFDGIEVTRAAYSGIIVEGDHNVVRHVYAHHNTGNGIHLRGDFNIAEYCTVYWNSTNNEYGQAPLGEWGAGLTAIGHADFNWPEGSVLRHNLVYNNWGEGLSSSKATNTTIEDNVVFDNWSVQLYLDRTDTAIVQRNLVYDTGDPDFSKRKASCLSIADEDNDSPYWSRAIVVINNLVVGGNHAFRYGSEVVGGGLGDCLIAYNTFVNSQVSNTFQIVSGDHAGTRIENNIVLEENPAIPIADVPDDAGLSFRHNLWSKTPERDASGSGDVVGDPQLAKSGSTAPGELTHEWFRPLSGSPAIGAATPNEIDEDYTGQQRGETPTVGGLEP